MYIKNLLKGICLTSVLSLVKGQDILNYSAPLTDPEEWRKSVENPDMEELIIYATVPLDLSFLKGSKISKLEIHCFGEDENATYDIVPNTLSVLSDTLTNIEFEFCKFAENDDFSSLTKLKSVYYGGHIDKSINKKLSEIPSLEEVEYMHALDGEKTQTLEFSDLQYAPKLTTLKLMSGQVRNTKLVIPDGSLEIFKNLKTLVFQSITLSKTNFEEIASMKNIEELEFHGVGRIGEGENELYYDLLVALKDSLKSLYFSFPRRTPGIEFDEFPEFIFSLTNLKKLVINDCNGITLLPEGIKNLTNLEYIDVFNTSISIDEILEYHEYLPNLKQIEAGSGRTHKSWPKYKNCSHCHSIYEDKDGLWGSENGKWCIIPDHCKAEYEECWSIKKGYPCCDHCKVRTVDKNGSWGVMNNNWCGIPTSC